jgi:hypothetical protein
MHQALHTQFDKLELLRKKVVEDVSSLSTDRYFKQSKNKWSIAQILTHILISEQLALGYMKKKSLGIDRLQNSSWKESLKLTLLKVSQRLPIKYKAPKTILDKTPEPLSFEDLSKDWLRTRIDLRAFLETIQQENVRKKIFKHPIAGMFDAPRGISFLREHLLHHLPQIRRQL